MDKQDAVGSVNGCFQQRRGDGELRSLHSAVFATRGADAHDRGACALHDGLDVGKVRVD